MQTPSAAAWTGSPIGAAMSIPSFVPALKLWTIGAAQRPAEFLPLRLGRGGDAGVRLLAERRAGEAGENKGGESAPCEAGRAHGAPQCPNALTIESVIFLASPNSISVLSRKKSSFSTPA